MIHLRSHGSMEASKASEKLQPGQRMKIVASDCGFASDIDLWAKTTGNTVISNVNQGGKIVAVVEKGEPVQANTTGTPNNGGTTIVLFSGDMDKALAAMIIAQGTRAMGKPATVFCTFWGLNLLRKPKSPHVKKSFIERMFGWMMPKGAKKFKLSKMNMEAVYTLLNVDRGVPEVWGSTYDVRELLRATYYALDQKPITSTKLSPVEKLVLKKALKKVKGTDIELLLKDTHVI